MDDDQKTLWELATRGVTPLVKETMRVPGNKKPPKKEGWFPEKPDLQNISPDNISFKASTGKENGFSGIDKRTDERLRRGKIPIEAVLDLHGRNRVEAYEVLGRFIVASHISGKRCVLIVTGKGRQGGAGILKQSFPVWIRESRLSHLVLQYHPAQPRHGGSGAYYVLLRRNREVSS